MNDKLYQKLKKRLDDVYSISPNELEIPLFTQVFKWATSYLKFFPFRFLVPIALITTLLVYSLFGMLVVRLVSVLQNGF